MKKSTYFILFLVVSFLHFSCGSSSNSTSTQRTNPHAEVHMQMHKEFQLEEAQKELDKQENMEPTKAQKQKFLIKKQQQGIDFYAVGNEPFWNIDMDFDKEVHFKNLDGVEFKSPAVQGIDIHNSNIREYNLQTESGEMIIQMEEKLCNDTMADQTFDYQVNVKVKLSKENESTTYQGCGDYVPDFRLHDIWAIIEVDGIKVNQADFKNKSPLLEINTSEEKVTGNDGCNSFNGSLKIENGKIIIGNLASTMMACFENTSISSKIGKTLSGNSLNYTIENNQLILVKNHKKVMVLKHID